MKKNAPECYLKISLEGRKHFRILKDMKNFESLKEEFSQQQKVLEKTKEDYNSLLNEYIASSQNLSFKEAVERASFFAKEFQDIIKIYIHGKCSAAVNDKKEFILSSASGWCTFECLESNEWQLSDPRETNV